MKKLIPVVALAVGGAGLAFAAPADATAVDVAATHDTHVTARSSSGNFGDAPVLVVDGKNGRQKHAFLKFKVPDVDTRTTIDRVELRLAPLRYGARGVTVHRTGGSWEQDRLTWRSMPAAGTQLGASDAVRKGRTEVISLDADRVAPGQVLALRIETPGKRALTFGSSEAKKSLRPVLRVTTSQRDTSTTPTTAPTTTPTSTPAGTGAFPPAAPFAQKAIGMSAPASQWDERVSEVGASGVTARRIFADLTSSGSSQLPLIRKAIADGMMPVISYKVPDPATLANGGYDSWLATLRSQLVALDAPVTATFWHEPRGDMDPAVFRAASLRFFEKVDAPDIAVGPILNGFLLDRRVDEFASYTDATLLERWEFVAVDSYQPGTEAAPGDLMPARAIPLLASWMDSVGHPDKPIGLGEYNGFSGAAIAEAGEALLSTPEVWFGLVWNSRGDAFTPLSGDRITAYKATKADARAAR